MLVSFSLDRYYSEKLFKMLGSFPILSDIIKQKPDQLKQILKYCYCFKYLPREQIIIPSAFQPWIYFVLNGECQVVDSNQAGTLAEILKAGQVFGELDALLDLTGILNVVADSRSQEVTLLGLNCSAFCVQTTDRELSDSTRILIYGTLHRALMTRYSMMLDLLKVTDDDVGEFDYEPIGFTGETNSKEHLVFFDVETKKLGIQINHVRRKIIDAFGKNPTNQQIMQTFLRNPQFSRVGVNAFINDISFTLQSGKNGNDEQWEEQSQSEPKKHEKKSVYTIGELTYLVVDDDQHYRNGTTRILKELGARKIHTEENGKEAWDFLCEHPTDIDVVLCDWMMPEMSGLDLFQKINEQSSHFDNIVFIMQTSIESRTSVVEAVKSGVHGYVLKPLSKKNLLKQIQAGLKNVRGAALGNLNL